jgi:predicted transcriptional regulator
MRALSIRQPYAEQIMRGTKRVEYRSRRTRIPLRVYVYASLRVASAEGELLPRGVLIGTVEVFKCTGIPGAYRWHLRAPRRLARPRKPKAHPQPVWFNPFP